MFNKINLMEDKKILEQSLEQYGAEKIDLPMDFKYRLHQILGKIFEDCNVDKEKKLVSYMVWWTFYVYDQNSNTLSRNEWKTDFAWEMNENEFWPNWENKKFFDRLLENK